MVAIKERIELATQNLTSRRDHLREDSEYYEAVRSVKALGTSMPPEMQHLRANVGWSRLYLDSLVERIMFVGFRYPGKNEADETLQKWWRVNALGEEAPIAHLESFIHGKAFVSISAPSREDVILGHPADSPIIRVESPAHMWVEINQRTRHVEWAVRFYDDPKPFGQNVKGTKYTLYERNYTSYLEEDGYGNILETSRVTHNLGIVPIVPFFNRERAGDRYGRSEIVPEIRSLQDIATRVVMNMQAASELMAVPQRLLFGVSKQDIDPSGGTDPYAKYKAFMANILTFSSTEGKAEQFQSAELSNYTGVLAELGKQFASYTGLPPQYINFQSDNPASADAIRASESRLVKKCEAKGQMFGNCWEAVMRIALLIMNGSLPEEAFQMEAILEDPATPTWAAKADAAQKLVGGKPIIPVKRARIDLNYTPEEREEMERWDQEEAEEMAAAMLGRPSPRFPLPTLGDQNGSSESSRSQANQTE